MEATIFIGTIIAGITELFRQLSPQVRGIVTVAVAVLVGVVIGLLDTGIGVKDISVAQGIVIAFGSVGVIATAKKVG